jgi:hypothetical protein
VGNGADNVSDLDRIENLERVIRVLHPEVQALREEVARLSTLVTGAPGPAGAHRALPPAEPPAPTHTPVAQPARPLERPARVATSRTLDAEALIGRYGTLALATLTILLGVGAFISWALAHHLLGPEVRIGLGALFAAGLAVAGWELLRTQSAPFGRALLGLALAVAHVDAWGAGPQLHLVSTPVALAAAALASAALSVLAVVEDEQALFAIGVGGALLAPFATADGQPRLIAFFIYGYVVLTLALVALRESEWNVGRWLLAAGTAVYVVAGLAQGHPASVMLAMSPAVFALAMAVTAIVVAPIPRFRVTLALSAVALVVLALGVRADGGASFTTAIVALSALGTVASYAAVWVLDADDREIGQANLAGAMVLPLALMVVAMYAMHASRPAALVGIGWAAGAAVFAMLDRTGRRGWHWTVAAMAIGAVITLDLAPDHGIVSLIVLSAYATALTLIVRRGAPRILLVPSAIALVGVAASTYGLLIARRAYHYTPFLTPESAAGLAVSAAWLVCAWHASRLRSQPLVAVRLSGFLIAFCWVRIELAGAISPDVATFLAIAYYAAVGVLFVFLGRLRGIPLLRHVGLGLSIYAALKAVVQASTLDAGARIGSYFLAGAFMMAVAFWYRARLTDAPGQVQRSTAPPG